MALTCPGVVLVSVRLVVEGPSAVEAATELAASPIMTAEVSERPRDAEKSVELFSAIVDITSAAGGLAGVAQAVLAWRDSWRRRSATASPPVERVIVLVGEERLPVDGLSEERLQRLLRRGLPVED